MIDFYEDQIPIEAKILSDLCFAVVASLMIMIHFLDAFTFSKF